MPNNQDQDRAGALKKRDARRHRFLVAHYDLYCETGDACQSFAAIKAKSELSSEESGQAESYWENQRAIKMNSYSGEERELQILTDGIFYVEEMIRLVGRAEAELASSSQQFTVQTLATMDIFVSHASSNAPLAKAFVDLVRAAFNIAPARIRCTSVDGYRLDAGDDFNERLREEIVSARVCVGLITQDSAASGFVLFELGARWGAPKPVLPLLSAGAGASVLPGPLSGTNALKCETRSQILQFVRNIGEQLGQTPNGADAYSDQVDALLKASKQAEIEAERRLT